MIKQELIAEVAERTAMSVYETRKIIEAAIDVATETLQNGEDIIIRNFGAFQIKKRAPKSVRNIGAGEQYTIAARKVVKFKPGKNLK